jgi:hypothetical protein
MGQSDDTRAGISGFIGPVIRALAQELVGLQPDVILSNSAAATAALQRATRTIPTVFATAGDPVASDLVARLDHPSGNVTGFAIWEPLSGLNMIAARLRPGAISESSSSHLPPTEGSKPPKPVVFPLGRSTRGTRPLEA